MAAPPCRASGGRRRVRLFLDVANPRLHGGGEGVAEEILAFGERKGLAGVDHAAVRGLQPELAHLGDEGDGPLVIAEFLGGLVGNSQRGHPSFLVRSKGSIIQETKMRGAKIKWGTP